MNEKVSSNYGFRNKSRKNTRDSSRELTKRTLNALDVRPSKERGQNFIVNELVISSIVEFGAPDKNEFIIEIGPGLGALTKALMPYGLKSVIEIEPAFARQVRNTYPEVDVREEDARYFDFAVYGQPVTIFANLPYSISSEMILSLCEAGAASVNRVVLMLQKEFAQRLCAQVGSKDYGILSVFCQRAAFTRLGPIIAAEYFHPRPKIDSQVLEFRFKKENAVVRSKEENNFFRKVVRGSFAKRRKMILNSLSSVNLAPEAVLNEALEASNIPAKSRAQELSYREFEKLAAELRQRASNEN